MHLNLETMGDQGSLQALADAPFPLTEVDKWVLAQSDEDYELHDWEDLRHIIGEWTCTGSILGTAAVLHLHLYSNNRRAKLTCVERDK